LRGSPETNSASSAPGRALAGLDGLPLRPASAWAIVEGEPGTADDRFAALDPGLALNRELVAGPLDALNLAAARPWWRAREFSALDRLWRYASALAWTARAIARRRGAADPERAARLGLLQPLGAWALAAAAPEAFAAWLDCADETQRRRWERGVLGASIGQVGARLARRWGASAEVAEVAWSFDGPDDRKGDGGDRLDVVRRARFWVERTPLALGAGPTLGPVADAARVRAWMAAVQAWVGTGGLGADVPPRVERLVRAQAALRLRLAEHRARDAELDMLAAPLPGEGDGRSAPDRLRAAIEALVAENARLGRAVDAARGSEAIPPNDPRWLDALAQFAAGAGHELNNPLAVVVGRAQLLLAKAEDPEARRSLRAIIAQAQRAHRMLRDLMAVARPSSARPRPCMPEELVRRVLDELRNDAEARGVGLWFDPQPGAPGVLVDPDHVRHAAETLARNALEASEPGGAVRVSLCREPEALTLRVTDTGRGLAPGESRHLLVPFYCGRQAGRGLGLGLPRLARALRIAGGSLTWSSRPGAGATFTAHIPIAALPKAEAS
jgi:signal transduction histidine kinase